MTVSYCLSRQLWILDNVHFASLVVIGVVYTRSSRNLEIIPKIHLSPLQRSIDGSLCTKSANSESSISVNNNP